MLERNNNVHINELLNKMTLKEKLAQLTQLDGRFFDCADDSEVTGPTHEMNITLDDVASCGSVLGVIGAEKIRRIQKKHLENDRNKIPLLFMLDIIHGFRTIFPINLALGCTWEPELYEKAMRISSVEAAASGINVNFAPMVDLVRDSRWGRVMESTGEDPYLNSLFGAAAVKGIQGNNLKNKNSLAACVKHIAGYGAAEGGRDYNTTEIGINTLFEFYMPAYRAAVDSGVCMAMSSFNALNGIPGTANRWLLKDILSKLWGFDGAVISDWGAVSELINHGLAANGKDCAKLALNAGVDIEMMTTNYLQYAQELIDEGILTIEQIDEAVTRVLELKEKLGLFEDPYKGASSQLEKELLCCKEHRKTAYEAALKSVVLLKNDGLLPIKQKNNIAVIGPYCQTGDLIGGWGCTGNFDETVTLRSALGENGISYCDGCGITYKNEQLFNEAIALAQKSDIVILALGEHRTMSGEAASRTELILPECQTELLNAISALRKPIVAVLFGGRPLILKDIEGKCGAIIEAWFPGTEGGNAVADILIGKALPEGRLTMSFPYSVGQLPLYYNHFSTGRPQTDKNDKESYVSKYLDAPNEPLYPFGYGLGYSKTEYKDFNVSVNDYGIHIDINVENIGDYPITDTVQIYVRDICASVIRPVKQLKKFKKLFLDVGERKNISFELKKHDLSFYMSDGNHHYESGDFEIMVGHDSENVIKKIVTVGDII